MRATGQADKRASRHSRLAIYASTVDRVRSEICDFLGGVHGLRFFEKAPRIPASPPPLTFV
jgi:hypothetical protein